MPPLLDGGLRHGQGDRRRHHAQVVHHRQQWGTRAIGVDQPASALAAAAIMPSVTCVAPRGDAQTEPREDQALLDCAMRWRIPLWSTDAKGCLWR